MTFSNKKDMEKTLEIEIQTMEQGKMTKMERAPILQTRTQRNANNTVKLWDVPVRYNHQDINRMINNQYGQIKGTRMRINGLYTTYWIDFQDPQIAEEILTQKAIILGEECLRVTPASVTYKQLIETQKIQPAAKVVGIPPGMTPRELMIILQQSGAETCYMPINSRANRRGIAFTTFPSEEHVTEFLKGGVNISGYNLIPLSKTTKTCHVYKAHDHLIAECPINKERQDREKRQEQAFNKFGRVYKRYQPSTFNNMKKKFTFQGNEYANAVRQTQNNNNKQWKNNKETKNPEEDNNIKNILANISQQLSQLNGKMDELNTRVEAIEEAIFNENEEDEEKFQNQNEMEEDDDTIKSSENQVGKETNKQVTTMLEKIQETITNMNRKMHQIDERVNNFEGKSNNNMIGNSRNNRNNNINIIQ
jgi:cell pole-organizing protein PopZ